MLQILFRQYLEAPQIGCVFCDPLADSDADNDSEWESDWLIELE